VLHIQHQNSNQMQGDIYGYKHNCKWICYGNPVKWIKS